MKHLLPNYGAGEKGLSDKSASNSPRSSRPQTGRGLEARLAKQGRELASARAMLGRYQTALQGSQVTVFAQDAALRYTAISNPLFGKPVDAIIGKTDDEVLPAGSRAQVMALKRAVLDGETVTQEVAIGDDGAARWYELHMEPARNAEGRITGLVAAIVDVTARKEGEAHLRLLMRELTHRSKNLLAVIQAMARQTATHTRSVEDFLDYFSARLQALAASHDLLVQQSWRGVSLQELIRSQLGHYLRGPKAQVTLQGRDVTVKPEAAQSLGLALHEMCTNAAKYGALSSPDGKVSIDWNVGQFEGRTALDLHWRESGGPPVKTPHRAGFGTLVIERNLTKALDARVFLNYAPDGFRCDIHIPASENLATQ